MNEKLFRTALKYIEKGYNAEDLRVGDDLYNSPDVEKELCIEYYWDIIQKGTNWAYEELNKLKTLNK